MAFKKKLADYFDERIIKVDEHYTIRIRKGIPRKSAENLIGCNTFFLWRVYKDVVETPENAAWWPDSFLNHAFSEETADEAERVARICLEDWKKENL